MRWCDTMAQWRGHRIWNQTELFDLTTWPFWLHFSLLQSVISIQWSAVWEKCLIISKTRNKNYLLGLLIVTGGEICHVSSHSTKKCSAGPRLWRKKTHPCFRVTFWGWVQTACFHCWQRLWIVCFLGWECCHSIYRIGYTSPPHCHMKATCLLSGLSTMWRRPGFLNQEACLVTKSSRRTKWEWVGVRVPSLWSSTIRKESLQDSMGSINKK